MGEWKETYLGEYADVLNGFAFKSEDFSTKGVPVIKIKNVASGKIKMDDVQFYPHELTDKLNKFLILRGSILIAMTGSHATQPSSMVGRVSRYDLEYSSLLNQRVGKIYSKDLKKLNETFLYYFLVQNDVTLDLAINAGGSANQANIAPEQIKSIPISLPAIEEQTAIASILSSLDDKIDLLHRQNKTLEALAETLFRQWFVEEAEEGWEETKIGKVLKTELGGTPSTKKPEYWDGDVPWINSGEVNNFRIDKASKYITKLGLKESNTKLLPQGTVVLAITGATLGQISILEIDACANQSVVGIIPNEDFPMEFVFLWVKLKIKEIISNQTGGAQQHINKDDVNETPIIIPPKALMKECMPTLSSHFNKISSNINQIRTLTRLRDTLLPKLMSGEVRVAKSALAEVFHD